MDVSCLVSLLSPFGNTYINILTKLLLTSLPSKSWMVAYVQWSSSTWYPWVAYTGAILIAFSAIKIINLRLHLMFDTTESIEEQPKDKHRERHRGNQANRSAIIKYFGPVSWLGQSQKVN